MLRIRSMTAADLSFGMRLKDKAGWNQTDADWRRYLDLEPEGCFIAELDGEEVATTTTCVFGTVGWVAMVLVDARFRRQGIGTALMEHALEFLSARGVLSVRLDATPLGRPVYEKLGFVADFELIRHEGILPARVPAHDVEPVQATDLEQIIALDRQVTATDRGKLLRRLFQERPEGFRVLRSGATALGYLTDRPGSAARQIGPCCATSSAGPLLLADSCRRYEGQRAYVDIPLAHEAARSLAKSLGLTEQRHLLRMHRGQAVTESVKELWASSGPEMG